MNSQTVTINLIPDLCVPAVVRVSQYDVGRPLTIRVLDGTGAASFGSSVTATIVGTKPSGLGFTQSGLITGNTVTLNTTLAMTQEAGMIPTEIRFTQTGENIGTANFILAVEPSPHPEGTTDGTYETMGDLETRLQGEIDDLSDRIDDIEAGGSGLTQAEKQLILTLFCKAAYAEDDAGVVYDALEALWTTTTRTITYNLSHVSSSNTTASIEQGQSYTTTLTASTDYTLNTVTVTMGGVDITSTVYSSGTITIPSVTGNIVITATAVLATQSITATYTQSGTVYDTDSLDSLKADLVVTANYAGGTSETVSASDYTLSGTLAEGTSTITVSYGGKTTTFNVTVTESMLYSLYNQTCDKSTYGVDSGVNLLENDIDFTILFDGIQTAHSGGSRLFQCIQPVSPYKGVYVGYTSASGGSNTEAQWFEASGNINFGRSSSGRIRILYSHEAGSDSVTVKWKSSGSVETFTLTNAYATHSGSLVVGGTASATSNSWVGTLTKFEVYNHILSQSEIDDFFGVS